MISDHGCNDILILFEHQAIIKTDHEAITVEINPVSLRPKSMQLLKAVSSDFPEVASVIQKTIISSTHKSFNIDL